MRLYEVFDDQVANPDDKSMTGIPREFMDPAWHSNRIAKIMRDTDCTVSEAVANHERDWKQYLKGLHRGFMSLNELAGLGGSVLASGGASGDNAAVIAGFAMVYILGVKLARMQMDNNAIRAAKKEALRNLKQGLQAFD